MTRSKWILASAATALAVGVTAGGLALADGDRFGRHGGMMMGGPGGWSGPGGGPARMFEMFDADGDGTITTAEIEETRNARFAGTDADGDGTVDLAEFETLFVEMIRPMMVDAFQHLDADGDAAVTAVEFAAPIDRMARFADRDGDGEIARDELMRGHGRGRGHGYDRDGDGD